MIETALQSLLLVVQWPAIGYLLLGVAIGLYFGAVPGLGGLVGMAILLPFTFTMEPISAFGFLLGMYAVTTTSDTIASVLLGIPGTAASQATILDGYPMAMRGEAARAFGAAFTVSAVGGVLGGLFLGLSIPVVRPLILSFASPEFFMLGLLGLTMVGSLSGGSMVKGLLAAALGLFISMIGYDQNGAIPRFTYDITYILEGLPLIPVVLGLFALPEVIELAVRDSAISRVPKEQVSGGILKGMADAARHWWLVVRSTVIGVYVGLLPGLGGSIVDWVAYGHAVQSAKDKDRFGKGDVRGVIAPETANNAMKGGALLPTVAFGIPGSAPMAILLGAFLIQGLTPGPEMLTSKLDVTFSLVWTLVIANIIGAVLLMVWAKQLSKITFVKGHLIIPAIVLFIFMGSWLTNNTMGDWITLLIFGVIGYAMKQGGFPRPPLVLGSILGPIMENALYITVESYGLYAWLARPICIAIAVLVVATLVYMAMSSRRNRRKGQFAEISEIERADPYVCALLIGLCIIVAGVGFVSAFAWPLESKVFPFTALVPMALLAVIALWKELRAIIRALGAASGNWMARLRQTSPLIQDLPRASHLYLWLVGILLVAEIAGQLVALPLFMGLYMVIWGGYRLHWALIYAAGGLAFIYVMFNEVIHVVWHQSWLFG